MVVWCIIMRKSSTSNSSNSKSGKKNVIKRERINLSFSMDNPKEAAVYHLLKAYSGNHKATQFIVDLIMNSQPNDKPCVVILCSQSYDIKNV